MAYLFQGIQDAMNGQQGQSNQQNIFGQNQTNVTTGQGGPAPQEAPQAVTQKSTDAGSIGGGSGGNTGGPTTPGPTDLAESLGKAQSSDAASAFTKPLNTSISGIQNNLQAESNNINKAAQAPDFINRTPTGGYDWGNLDKIISGGQGADNVSKYLQSGRPAAPDTSGLQGLNTQIQNLDMYKTDEGRRALLTNQNGPTYTGGDAAFDNAVLKNDAGFQGTLNDALNQQQGLNATKALGIGNANFRNDINSSQYGTDSKAVRDYLSGKASGIQTDAQNQVNTAGQGVDQQRQAALDAQNKTIDSQIQQDVNDAVQRAGNGDYDKASATDAITAMRNIDTNPYYTRTPTTDNPSLPQNAVDPAQIAQYNSIENMLGGQQFTTPTYNFAQGQNAAFNNQGFMGALQKLIDGIKGPAQPPPSMIPAEQKPTTQTIVDSGPGSDPTGLGTGITNRPIPVLDNPLTQPLTEPVQQGTSTPVVNQMVKNVTGNYGAAGPKQTQDGGDNSLSNNVSQVENNIKSLPGKLDPTTSQSQEILTNPYLEAGTGGLSAGVAKVASVLKNNFGLGSGHSGAPTDKTQHPPVSFVSPHVQGPGFIGNAGYGTPVPPPVISPMQNGGMAGSSGVGGVGMGSAGGIGSAYAGSGGGGYGGGGGGGGK